MEDYIEKESSDVAQSTHDTEEKTKAPPRHTHTEGQGHFASGGAASGKEKEERKTGREGRNFLKGRAPGSPIQCPSLYEDKTCTNFSLSHQGTKSPS